MTRALRAIGIEDYLRASTTVSARGATLAEASDLDIAPGSAVMVVRALDAQPEGSPLLVNLTRFAAERVELELAVHEGE